MLHFKKPLTILARLEAIFEILGKLRTEQTDTSNVNIEEIRARLSAAERTISAVLNTLALPEGRGRFKKSPRNEQV